MRKLFTIVAVVALGAAGLTVRASAGQYGYGYGYGSHGYGHSYGYTYYHPQYYPQYYYHPNYYHRVTATARGY